MKKFFAGVTKGVFATQMKASDLSHQPALQDQLVTEALAEGKAFAITCSNKAEKESVASEMQKKFMDRINTLVDTAFDLDSMDLLNELFESGKLAKDIFEYIEDLLNAKRAELDQPMVPVADVLIPAGLNVTKAEVLKSMKAAGLVLGGSCKTSAGEGTVLGFEVTSFGTMVVVSVEGKNHKYLVSAVEGDQQMKNEESVKMAKNNDKKVTVSAASQKQIKGEVKEMVKGNVNNEAMSMIEKAIAGDIASFELTAEEREQMAEMKLQEDLAKFAQSSEELKEAVSQLANSDAAKALLALAGNGSAPKAAEAPKAPEVQGAPIVNGPARSAQRSAQPSVRVNATQNQTKNQNNGGHVQMNNNTQTRQGNVSAAFGGQNASANRQGSTPSVRVAFSGAGAQTNGWAGIESKLGQINLDEYVGRTTNGNQDFVWYIEESVKYAEQMMTLEEIQAAGMTNEKLGITDIKFYSPESIASHYNRQVREDDFVVLEVFFGMTSYEFTFRRNATSDQKPYIYSSNIARKQTKSNVRYCEYVSSRRTDKLTIVKQADGTFREARKVWENGEQVIHAEDRDYAFEVGGQSWVNASPNFGIKIGQPVFIQLMLLVDELSGLKAYREAKKN